MTRSLSLYTLSLFTLAALLAACTQSVAPPDPPAAGDRSSPQRNNATNNALGGQHWLLQDATDAQGRSIDALLIRPTQPLQFDFVDGLVRIANACNGIRGDVHIDGDSLRFGPLVSTKMACADPAVMALDSEVAKRLESEIRFRLLESDPPQLMLTTANGDTLRFVGTGTPEERFGGPGTIMFMEVAAHIKPCRHPMTPMLRQCLEIRERQYDAQGLSVGTPGEWQLFHDTIEDYIHEEGVRNVLRVKRFPIANPPMDGPTTGYVLDMVIESEIVDP